MVVCPMFNPYLLSPFCLFFVLALFCVPSPQLQDLEIPCTPGFSFAVFLSKPTVVRDWNTQGLPTDAFCTENAVITTQGNRSVHVDSICCYSKQIEG